MSRFAPHPAGLPWPTETWPIGPLPASVDAAAVEAAVGRCLAQPPELGLTLALLVVHRGRLVVEAYGPDTTQTTTLISWSMAKSMTQAVFGLLLSDGRVELDTPAPVPEWAGDRRRTITIRHLLEMSSGLKFVEDYVDGERSDVIEMLFGSGSADHAAYAAAQPLEHPPGTVFNYSSGTTNILARIAGTIVGGGPEGMARYLRERLFDPIGMRATEPKFDQAGTFVGSSYVYATARDFARFGYLYLRDGIWAGHRILPEGWADAARTPIAAPIPATERHGYGQHWWRWFGSDDTFSANGYETQRTIVSPARDVVLVRLGKSPAELGPAVDATLHELMDMFTGAPDGAD